MGIEATAYRLAQLSGPAYEVLQAAVWQSQAHQERFAAGQLLSVFREFGMAEAVLANGEFTTYEAREL